MDKESFLRAFPAFKADRETPHHADILFQGSSSFFLQASSSSPGQERVLSFIIDNPEKDDETVLPLAVWATSDELVLQFRVHPTPDHHLAYVRIRPNRLHCLRTIASPHPAVDIVFNTTPPTSLRIWSTTSSSNAESTHYVGQLGTAINALLPQQPLHYKPTGSGSGGRSRWRAAWLAALTFTQAATNWSYSGRDDPACSRLAGRAFADAAACVGESETRGPITTGTDSPGQVVANVVIGPTSRVVQPDKLALMVAEAERRVELTRQTLVADVYGQTPDQAVREA